MQKLTLRTAVTAVLFLAAAAYLLFARQPSGINGAVESASAMVSDVTYWQRTRGERVVNAHYPLTLSQDLHQLPLQIGPWTGVEVPQSDVNALIMLDPEQFVERLYQTDRGDYIWLTLIGSRQSRSFHSPTDCYYAAGWENESRPLRIPIEQGEIQGTLIQARQARAQGVEDHVSFYFYLFPDSQRDLQDGVIMFRVTSGLYGTLDETVQLLGTFLDHFFSGVTPAAQPSPFQEMPTQPAANEARLDGFQFSHQQLPADGVLGVDLRWFAMQKPARRYQSVLRVLDEDGRLWSEKETRFSDAYAFPLLTTEWSAQTHYWDHQEVTLLPGTPPGSYEVWLRFIDYEAQQPLTFVSNSQAVLGPDLLLGSVDVVAPLTPLTVPPEAAPLTAWQKGGVQLAGFMHDGQDLAAGDAFTLTFFWQKVARLAWTSQVAVTLQSEAGEAVASWRLPLVNESFPPLQWAQNAQWRGQHRLRLPAGVASGSYQLWVDGSRQGTVQVTAPARIWTQPPFETAVSSSFSDLITLVGYTIDAENGRVRLIWQGQQEMPTSYHVFLHVVDASGHMVAQSDGLPAGWTRPTTGWAAGEFVVDEHSVPPDLLAAANLQYWVGLYNPATGERLQTSQGDRVLLQK